MKIPFLKMQGIGNDFVVISDLGDAMDRGSSEALGADFGRQICDRRYGVGADQILWLRRPVQDQSADARMEIINSDGSTAEMCGNGIRAVGVYLHRYGRSKGRKSYRVETPAGPKIVDLVKEAPAPEVRVDMGAPEFGKKTLSGGEAIEVDGQRLEFFEVGMGNPHAVFFVDGVDSFPVEKLGPLIEKHSRFPKRTNVEFVELQGSSDIKVRVWERGAGITLACGTGACASAVATLATGRAKGPLRVHLPGGTLTIEWAGEGKPVMMTGPAEEVFRGEYEFRG